MAEFDFPPDPEIGDTVVPPNGYTYMWDGVKWKIVPTPGSGGGGGGPSPTYVNTFNTRSGDVALSLGDVIGAGGAPTMSPSFNGLPLAPTADPGTHTTQIATTEFVNQAVGSGVATGGGIPEPLQDSHVYGRGGLVSAWHQVIAADNDIVDGGNF